MKEEIRVIVTANGFLAVAGGFSAYGESKAVAVRALFDQMEEEFNKTLEENK